MKIANEENEVLICQPVNFGHTINFHGKQKKSVNDLAKHQSKKRAQKQDVDLFVDSSDCNMIDLITDDSKRKAGIVQRNAESAKVRKGTQVYGENEQSHGVYGCRGRGSGYCHTKSGVCNACCNVGEGKIRSRYRW